jgi:hypothetical protein
VKIRDLFASRYVELDPAEKWEIHFSQREGGEYYNGNYTSHPYTPRERAEVPAGAMESLAEPCGIEGLHQVFIVPWAVRCIDFQNTRVISPNSVLAIGSRAVGLWTEKPQPGVKVMIRVEELAAIEDVMILLYGRLSFLPFGEKLRIRYNTVARQRLEPALLELRKRLAGPEQGIPRNGGGSSVLPFKWNYLLHSPRVGLAEDAAVAFRFARVPRRRRKDPLRGELLVLNPRELVYACDPADAQAEYGVDSFIVPRSLVAGISAGEGGLDITAKGTRFSLSMAPELSAAAVQWLG